MSQDYNSTINLPKTEFPMRAGLPKREPDMLAAWEQGIGSCWVGAFAEDRVREALDVSSDVRITALMPMGYPAADAVPLDLHTVYRELSDVVEEL